jgi:uncharacterized protein YjdB
MTAFRSRQLARLLALASLPAAACDYTSLSTNPDQCFVVVVAIAPATASVAVGESIQLSASYNQVSVDCLPGVPASALHWQSEDTTIVSVDSLSGVVTGRRVGQATVSVHAPTSSRVLGGALVKVTGP